MSQNRGLAQTLLCIENVIPFFNIIAPTILHIIMGKFILLTFTKAKAITKETIRIISNADYLAHSSKIFFNMKLLKLDDIMTFQLGTFMYKLKYNKLPSAIPHTGMFVTNENIHSHNTRNKNGYLIPNVRTNCRKFTVSYAGPILWNSFPQKLRQLPSEVLFKRKLKYILLATYWEILHYIKESILLLVVICFRPHPHNLRSRRQPAIDTRLKTSYKPNPTKMTELTLRELLL